MSLVGFVFIVTMLNIMNSSPTKKKSGEKSQVQFEVKKVKNKSRQKIQKKKKAVKKAKIKSLKPKMDMSLMSSGLDLGVDILGLSSQDSGLLSQAGESAMTEDIVDQLPLVQYREPMPYPEHAKEKNINGHVTVNILVNKEGSVEKVKLLDSQPEGVFDQVAVNSVKTWSFSPAHYQGRVVSVWVKQKLKFQVN